MATQLPKLNQNLKNSKETNLIAVIDNDSLKKIVSADKKTFTNTVSKNTVKITAPFQSFFQSYKEDTLEVFSNVSNTLKNILDILIQNGDTLKSEKQDNKIQYEKKERKEKRVEAEKREEKREASSKKSTRSELEKAIPYLTDPSRLQDAALGHFLGTSIGAAMTKIIGNPIGVLSQALRTNPSLLVAIPAIMQETKNTFNETDQISDPMANNSDLANKLARFLHGDINKDDNNTLLHYLKMMGIGGAIGAKSGGIFGGILGMITGGAGAYVTDKIGPESISTYMQSIIDKVDGFFQIFSKTENLEAILTPKIDQAKQLISDYEIKISENIHRLLELEKQKNEAFKAGDQKRIDEIQNAINKLNEENLKMVVTTDAVKVKLDEYTEQLIVDKKQNILSRFATWFGESSITVPGTDLEFKFFISKEFADFKKNIAISTLNLLTFVTDYVLKPTLLPLNVIAEDFTKIVIEKANDIFETILKPFVWIYNKLVPMVEWIRNLINDNKSLFGKINTPEFSKGQIEGTNDDLSKIGKWFDQKWEGLVDFLGGETPNKNYKALDRSFPGKDADDKNTRYLTIDPISNLLDNGIPIASPSPNLLTEMVKQKTLTITELAKTKNENETGAIGKMLTGMMNNFVTNNSSVNNTSISKQTIMSRQNMSFNPSFSGYGRGE